MLQYWESEDLSYFATDGARSRWDVERRAMVGFPARPEGWGAATRAGAAIRRPRWRGGVVWVWVRECGAMGAERCGSE